MRGVVQGVGFRPTVVRLARSLGLGGAVLNDGHGVLIRLWGPPTLRETFVQRLLTELPPLARVDALERSPDPGPAPKGAFHIAASAAGGAHTELPPDVATCPACLAEVLDPHDRRHRYPFASCTHCGPRYSIAVTLPFDRETTTMVDFPLCPACRAEYEDPKDRRFHAQATACPQCGPRAWLAPGLDGDAPPSNLDPVAAAAAMLLRGKVVAIKGLGSWHLCCDATQPAAVARLRALKRRSRKPLALMAGNLEVVKRYTTVHAEEARALGAPSAPIVLLPRRPPPPNVPALADEVAPGQRNLGFMLPATPLHHLLLADLPHPIVCTSGNLSDEPPCIEDEDAQARLAGIADGLLFHDRRIQHRVDDSVVRGVDGALCTARRARGLAPHAERLPAGLEGAPALVAAGAQLKSTFALVKDAQVILSPHLGDLDHLSAFEAFQSAYSLLRDLYEHKPAAVACDLHPEYRSTAWARQIAAQDNLPLLEVQHHHAHVAAVLLEHGYPADGPPVLGLALDGLGLGEGGALWGGELLLCSYRSSRRLAGLRPTPLLGGDLAAYQPWRNLYAQLRAALPWSEVMTQFGDLEVIQALCTRPLPLLEQALSRGLGGPLASSAGRLFDAVAAALGICFERAEYEGQAAIELEAYITPEDLEEAARGPRYALPRRWSPGGVFLDPAPLWTRLLSDVQAGVRPDLIAARFHLALAEGLVDLCVGAHADTSGVSTVVLAGGCFQNATLVSQTRQGLCRAGLRVLTPARAPAHDGGVALGQAAVAAARLVG